MRHIKKYANRKLYDTTDKKYISMDQLAELIKEGHEVTITDNKTGDDLTSSIVSQLIARDRMEDQNHVPSSLLIQLLRKGRGTVMDYAKKYALVWQSALTMTEDEIDRPINLLVKDKELSKSEGIKLKKEILHYAGDLKRLIAERIDNRIHEVMTLMNLPTKEQVGEMKAQLEALAQKINLMEKLHIRKQPH